MSDIHNMPQDATFADFLRQEESVVITAATWGDRRAAVERERCEKICLDVIERSATLCAKNTADEILSAIRKEKQEPREHSRWEGLDGSIYVVIAIANRCSTIPDFPENIVYRNSETNKIFTLPSENWHKTMTPLD